MTITSVAQLQQLAETIDGVNVKITLNGGLSSSKTIYFNNGKFTIFNDIDASVQRLSPEELYTHSNIGQAIDQKALKAI